MMLRLYSLMVWLMQPLVRRKIKRRAVLEPLYGERIEERFGQYPYFDKLSMNGGGESASGPLIWIHAVSLGETRAAAILLKALRGSIPKMQLLLTSGTATGRLEGSKLLQESDMQVWQPWDTKAATQSFFIHFKPAIGILMETEIWPNLIMSAKSNGVPVVLANARLSEKSLVQSRKWRWLASPAYQSLSAVYAQTSEDAMRLTAIEASVSAVFGNLKFDITPSAEQLGAASLYLATCDKPIVVFASSREGEEALFLAALKALPEVDRASRQWLIVPRHPQRFKEVASLIEGAGFAVSHRGHWQENSIWLGDSLGEMTFYFGISSVALLGGSFLSFGGQNLIEALACGCPIVMGLYTYNFEEAARLAAESNVAVKVAGMPSAIKEALLLKSFDKEKARQFVFMHQGAAAKTVTAIQQLLK
jgi:3-deoxy-D-manno-octulosonic-acid transferase